MKISIIIPVYNVEEYIERCLLSCIKQDISHNEYEIIVVNDGSPDNSIAIVERIAMSYTNIKIINQENKGLSGARNTGIRHAKGDYIWFIDSDDWIAENCLKKLTNKLLNDSPDCLLVGVANVVNNKIFRRKNFDSSAKSGIELLEKDVEVCAPFAIWKSDFLKEHNLSFYEGILHEDIEFSPRAYYLANKISFVNEIIYHVYKNPNSITQTPNPKRSFDIISVVNVQLSNFMKKVDKEHMIIYHNRIALNINNALNYMVPNSKENKKKLNKMIYEYRYMFIHLLKSSYYKYRIEGILFYLFPKHTFQMYMFCQIFNRESTQYLRKQKK